MSIEITTPHQETPIERLPFQSMVRGFRCRCPNCGEGRLFASFTKPVETCATCNEDMSHQRADDFPAYLVIFIVGHIVVAGYLASEFLVQWTAFQHMALWLPVTLLMSIALLQPLKGGVIGLQWAWRIHGFGGINDNVSEI